MDTAIFLIALSIVMFCYVSLWFGISLSVKRYDVVDSAWGLGFVLIAWISLVLRNNFGMLQLVSAALVSIWGMRLAAHIGSRTLRKPVEDHRYQAMRDRWGKDADRKAYTNIFLLQGALILIISAPMLAIALTKHAPNVLSYIGWTIWVFGIAYEAIADRQLTTFLAQRAKGSHAIMDKGLWSISRHPNYFGEVVVWWGAATVSLATGTWWGIIGAATITLLITKISGIPPLEKHYNGNKDYETYRKRTPILVPRLWRKT